LAEEADGAGNILNRQWLSNSTKVASVYLTPARPALRVLYDLELSELLLEVVPILVRHLVQHREVLAQRVGVVENRGDENIQRACGRPARNPNFHAGPDSSVIRVVVAKNG